jgi:PPOX class probable FMN-dependent enzyme
MVKKNDASTIKDEAKLRDIMGETMDIAVEKNRPKLDKHCCEFISRSPFLCIGTSDTNGNADVSPRGDAPGFVQILNDRTIFIPDRPGNNRLDTMTNIVENPNVGLLFIIPGYNDTLRVNGMAKIVNDEALMTNSEIKGRIPKVGILIDVRETFLHCAKAFMRSKLWDSNSIQDRKEMPTLAHMILDQVAAPDAPPTIKEVEDADEFIDDNYKTGLY